MKRNIHVGGTEVGNSSAYALAHMALTSYLDSSQQPAVTASSQPELDFGWQLELALGSAHHLR